LGNFLGSVGPARSLSAYSTSSRRLASSAAGIDLTFSVTKTRCRKLSTSGAWSARSSRQAGLLSRSQATSSTLAALSGELVSATVDHRRRGD